MQNLLNGLDMFLLEGVRLRFYSIRGLVRVRPVVLGYFLVLLFAVVSCRTPEPSHLSLEGCNRPEAPEHASVAQIVSSPHEYHQRYVTVVGFVLYDAMFGLPYIYQSENDYKWGNRFYSFSLADDLNQSNMNPRYRQVTGCLNINWNPLMSAFPPKYSVVSKRVVPDIDRLLEIVNEVRVAEQKANVDRLLLEAASLTAEANSLQIKSLSLDAFVAINTLKDIKSPLACRLVPSIARNLLIEDGVQPPEKNDLLRELLLPDSEGCKTEQLQAESTEHV